MKTDLAASAVRAAIEARAGPVSAFEALTEGLDSQAFGFRRGEDAFVARVNRRDHGFRKDAFIATTFASDLLPAPAVLSIDRLGVDLWLCISRRAPGRALHEAAGDGALLAPAILAVLDAIGAADVSALTGYGRIDAAGAGACATWREHLLQVFDSRFYDWPAVADRVDPGLRSRAGDALLRLAPTEAAARTLIHGDFGTGNLVVDADKITAVVDWDRAAFGDPAYDAANLFYWREPELAAVRAALLARHGGDQDWRRRLLAYQLRIALEELYDAAVARSPLDLEWLEQRCSEVLEASRAERS